MSLERARTLRRNMTEAEHRLWAALRRRALAGAHFRKQVPLGPYIVDFLCWKARLVVEVDGSQHAENERDLKRDCWLKERGYMVLRFWNNEVLGNLPGVLRRILEHLSASEPPPPARCARHLPRRGGEV